MPITPELIRGIAAKYHTPFYVYEETTIRRQCRALKNAITYPHTRFRYACKALTLRAVLEIIRSEGFWIDAVSINEVDRALKAEIKPHEILYTGEGASELVYRRLLDKGIPINVSSLTQLELLGAIAPGASCSLRINPGEGHGAHNKVNTGGPSSKFGIYFDQIDEAKRLASKYSLTIRGIHSHIGSGTDIAHWLRIKDATLNVAKQFSELEFVDLGGGLPVVYDPETDKSLDIAAWGSALSAGFEKFSREMGKDIQLQVEPGRFLVAESGFLIAEVQIRKRTPAYDFILVNSGMNHNPRPALYGSFHPIDFVPKTPREVSGETLAVVGGNLCESGDIFTIDADGTLLPRKFRDVEVGDFMVLGVAGAYCHSMRMEYNSINSPPSLLLTEQGAVKLIERRGTLEDVIRKEVEVY